MPTPKILKDIDEIKDKNTKQDENIKKEQETNNTQDKNINRAYDFLNPIRTYHPTAVARVDSGIYTSNPIPEYSEWSVVTVSGDQYYRTKEGYMIKGSSSKDSSSSYPLFAIDRDTSTAWISSAEQDAYLTIYFPNPITIRKIKLICSTSEDTLGIYLQGSNDEIHWDNVWMHAYEDITTGEGTIDILAYNSYTVYRLWFLNSQRGASVSVSEFQISEYTEKTILSHTLESSTLNPNAWTSTIGQRVLIKTPNDYDTTRIESNTLEGIPVEGILLPGKYYELVYRGSKFTIVDDYEKSIRELSDHILLLQSNTESLYSQLEGLVSFTPIAGLPIGTEFYIEEEYAGLTPYIIVQEDYKSTNNVIAMRKNLLPARIYHDSTDDFRYYGDTNNTIVDIDGYLVNDYKTRISNSVSLLDISIDVSYRALSSSTTVSRSVFLPSLTELTGNGFDGDNNYDRVRVEGSQFTYFKNGGSKVAEYNGVPSRYHLRTICNPTNNYHIYSDGKSILNSSFSTYWYVRPFISINKSSSVRVRVSSTNVLATAEVIG